MSADSDQGKIIYSDYPAGVATNGMPDCLDGDIIYRDKKHFELVEITTPANGENFHDDFQVSPDFSDLIWDIPGAAIPSMSTRVGGANGVVRDWDGFVPGLEFSWIGGHNLPRPQGMKFNGGNFCVCETTVSDDPWMSGVTYMVCRWRRNFELSRTVINGIRYWVLLCESCLDHKYREYRFDRAYTKEECDNMTWDDADVNSRAFWIETYLVERKRGLGNTILFSNAQNAVLAMQESRRLHGLTGDRIWDPKYFCLKDNGVYTLSAVSMGL